MAFVKGQSGFPAGRTKEQRAKEKAFADCILGLAGPGFEKYARRLDEIAMNAESEDRDSIRAIEVLLTRALGKPPEHVIHDEPNDLTDEEYQAELAAIAREHVAGLSPEEKMRLLSGGSETVQ